MPGGLPLHEPDPHNLFSAHQLSRLRAHERFLAIDFVLRNIALLVVLYLYARRGAVLVRESAAGRVGTGMLLAMLGLALVWIVQLPFDVAELWWERRYHIAHQGYVEFVIDDFFSLGGEFLFVSAAAAVVMGLAGPLRRTWWAAAVPVFVAFAALQAFAFPYLLSDLHRLEDPRLAADATRFARQEGVPSVHVYVERVHRYTTAPNAEAVGFGSTRRVILWDTLYAPGFTNRERRVVVAHELGHHARHHIPKYIGWYALFVLPMALAVALATRRRGGIYEPTSVPIVLLVLAVAQLVATPLQNAVSRRYETEADWMALRTTRDPAGDKALMRGLAAASLADPKPPTWSYVLLADHPTITQRIALADAWAARRR
ncbi:MAG: endopeptidase [Solirubrobacteraceae bacterium]|nr:endopeptidase [Solirubrobacteraceae bacterium]